MSSPAIPMSIKLTAVQHRRLTERAGKNGYSNATYVQMLFDAGFAARVGQERGDPVSDADLDEQVRLVFALAGQFSTAAISRGTGIPEARVERILHGWRTAAKDLAKPEKAAGRAKK